MRRVQDAHLLLVDDNEELLSLIMQALRDAGYLHLTGAASCAEARTAFSRSAPDFMVLDINLPDGDGFALFREFRTEQDIPALFLSARDADTDRLFGLGLGADDYMTKPFLTQELLLRIQLILRRTYRSRFQEEGETVRLGPCTVDLRDAAAMLHGVTQPLTATERALLQKLADNRGHIVTFDALCQWVWKDGYYGYENALNVHIRHLREKIEADPSHPVYLLTVRGLGYKLKEEQGE